jgi:Ca2+-binding EF-hand superfamily protein
MTTLQSIQELHNKVFNQNSKKIDYNKAISMLNKAKNCKSFEKKYQLVFEVILDYPNTIDIKQELIEFNSILKLIKKINRPNSEMIKDEDLKTLFEQAINS